MCSIDAARRCAFYTNINIKFFYIWVLFPCRPQNVDEQSRKTFFAGTNVHVSDCDFGTRLFNWCFFYIFNFEGRSGAGADFIRHGLLTCLFIENTFCQQKSKRKTCWFVSTLVRLLYSYGACGVQQSISTHRFACLTRGLIHFSKIIVFAHHWVAFINMWSCNNAPNGDSDAISRGKSVLSEIKFTKFVESFDKSHLGTMHTNH